MKGIIPILVLCTLCACQPNEHGQAPGVDSSRIIQPLMSMQTVQKPDQMHSFYFSDPQAASYNYYVLTPGLDEGYLGANSSFALPVKDGNYWVIKSNYLLMADIDHIQFVKR